MNADELEIYEFLQQRPNIYISIMEIGKRLGARKRFDTDRHWARPLLRRMEIDGLVEVNLFGEYKLKTGLEAAANFKDALGQAGASLGDTTIITLHDIEESEGK